MDAETRARLETDLRYLAAGGATAREQRAAVDFRALLAAYDAQAARLAAVEQAVADNQWLKESHGVTRANEYRPRGYCTGCHDKHPCDVISLLEDLEAALKGSSDA